VEVSKRTRSFSVGKSRTSSTLLISDPSNPEKSALENVCGL
jgi:hypothetical protein